MSSWDRESRGRRSSVAVAVALALWAAATPLRAAGLALKLDTALAPSGAAPRPAQAARGGGEDAGALVPLHLALGLAAIGAAAPVHVEELLLMVDVNDQRLNETALFLRDTRGELYAAARDLQRWRLRTPNAAPLVHRGQAYFRLSAIPGLLYRFDEATQSVAIHAQPQAFEATAFVTAAPTEPAPVRPQPGGFLNYDLVATRQPGLSQRSGLLEFGAFGPAGLLTSDFLAQNGSGGNRFTRLETTWTSDRPSRTASLRIGDAISGAGSWGRAVRFGGIQYATNFATQPNLITFPLQSFSGQAALPSTVDLYVNNARIASQSVPPGPFTISNVPVLAGSGNVTMVVRDALGREQIVTRPFYASPTLLRKGLRDFSYEAGFEREDFGLSSDHYGRWLASGTYRFGLTDALTEEWHGELMGDQATLGGGAALLAPGVGVLSASLAGSTSSDGLGSLVALGAEHVATPFSFSAQTQLATSRFRQIGLLPGELPPSQVSNLNLGYSTGRAGSIGLNYTVLAYRDAPRARLLSASYGLDLGRFGELGVSALDSLEGGGGRALFLTWTLPIDGRTTATVSRSTQGGTSEWAAALQRALPAGDGYGYDVQASSAGHGIAELDLQNGVGTSSLQVAQQQGQTSEQASISGGLAYLGGGLHFARQLTDSFGLVEVPGYAGVRVYADNQLVGRTDARGEAMIPVLRPYQDNRIGIEQADLPLNAQVGALTMDAVPYYRSGVVVKFPVRPSRGALFTIRLEDGKPMPAGATVQLKGQKTQFPVGLGGEVYVTGLSASNDVRASWNGQSCEFEVPFTPSTDPLPKLGSFLCKGVRP